MAQVPQKVLAWLYSVLHEYHDPQRAYSDVARVLSAYPLLAPRTQIYTDEGGADALLLTLSGTLPATFRGTVYHYPLKLHIPHAYPHQGPILFVEPGQTMLVRPGQHVSVDGRIYHPYLRDWSRQWERANLADLLYNMQQVFAKEPPVVIRSQPQQALSSQPPQPPFQQQPGSKTIESRPTPPPKQYSSAGAGPATIPPVSAPPPVPPKPDGRQSGPSPIVSRDGPPLPPLPPERVPSQTLSPSSETHDTFHHAPQMPPQWTSPASVHYSDVSLQRVAHQRHLPPSQAPQQQLHHLAYNASPVSPISPVNGYSELPGARNSAPLIPRYHVQAGQPSHPALQSGAREPQPRSQQLYSTQPNDAVQRASQMSPRKMPLDLLSDPFELALPTRTQSAQPAPPIPPNPEKEHLLHAISEILVRNAEARVNQNLSAVAPLQAQWSALRATHERLESEIKQLAQIERTLSSNEEILRRSIKDCDRTIAAAKSKTQPPIDEVLMAPTMVANQLWTLCAEETACREVMYALQRAVDRGRISGSDFVKHMRALGRESFMKMALARKCAHGLGLDTWRPPA